MAVIQTSDTMNPRRHQVWLDEGSDLTAVLCPGGRGDGPGEPSGPRPHPRPELVPGPGAAEEAVRGVRRAGLGHRPVPGRRRVHPRGRSPPGRQEKLCLARSLSLSLSFALCLSLSLTLSLSFLLYCSHARSLAIFLFDSLLILSVLSILLFFASLIPPSPPGS